jgi:hypothetical protein
VAVLLDEPLELDLWPCGGRPLRVAQCACTDAALRRLEDARARDVRRELVAG